MSQKRILAYVLRIFLIAAIICPAIAQMRKVHKFKKVEIPFNLVYEDSIFEKGKYDFEILANRSLQTFHLRIIKSGKNLCLLAGEILRDKPPGARGEEMEEVPDDPTLKMKRIPAKKMVHIIFEAGKQAAVYPCFQIRFQIKYE